MVRRHSDMGLVRERPGPEAFVTFRGQTMEEAGSEHGLERANEDARRIWLNKMKTRNRISRYKLYTDKIINSKYLLQYPNYLLRPCKEMHSC